MKVIENQFALVPILGSESFFHMLHNPKDLQDKKCSKRVTGKLADRIDQIRGLLTKVKMNNWPSKTLTNNGS